MSPSSHCRTNTSRTAREYAGSNVNRVRLQSHDAPIIISCSRIVPPVSLTNAQTRATNASRPRSKRVFPSFAMRRSTTFCVAIPAWSVPGSHRASRPRIRSNRMSTSCVTLFRPWPMCSTAVTLGGGMTITYVYLGASTRAVNTARSSQRRYSGRSTACGSYWGGSATLGGIPYNRQDGEGRGRLGRTGEVGSARVTTSPTSPNLPQPPPSFPYVLEYRHMPDESPVLSPSRLVRWFAIAAVIVFNVALYFRDGRRVPPLTGPPTPPGQPAN